MIAWLASYPRSGNGFIRRVLKDLYVCLCPSVYLDSLDAMDQTREGMLKKAAQKDEYAFVKTHDRISSDTFPTLYLIRDARDALVSYAWYCLMVNEKRSKEEVTPQIFSETLHNLIGRRNHIFGSWSENVNAWTARPNTAILRFEEFVVKPEETVAQALATLNIELPKIPGASVTSFVTLQQKMPHLFRRGKVGSWKDEFPESLLDLFWKEHGETMRKFGYGESDENSLGKVG